MQNILTDAVRHLKSIREEDVASMNAEEACTQSAFKEACTQSAMPCVDDGAVPIEWCMRAECSAAARSFGRRCSCLLGT